MAISTRSIAVAEHAGRVVKFGAREPLGSISERIFTMHATRGQLRDSSTSQVCESSNSVQRILSVCAGLPIALAVTGCAVAFLSSAHGNFEAACNVYATHLDQKRSSLGDEDTMEGRSLNACMLLSLEYLEATFVKWKADSSRELAHSITDLYTSLCVFENEAWAPVSILGRLWQLDEDAAMYVANLFCAMSLATFHVRRSSSESSPEPGIVLHVLQVDFCRQQAMEARTSSHWHTQILNGYLVSTSQPLAKEPYPRTVLGYASRAWWSKTVPDDGYIHENLSRHLVCAGHGLELAALLLDARWTALRGSIDGISALKTDFENLEEFLMRVEMPREQEADAGDVRGSFKQIFRAVQLSLETFVKGMRAFQFQICGRLISLRRSNAIIDAYVKSVERFTPKPYLFPVKSFFPELDSPLIMEVPIRHECWCVACSPCGRYIAAGAGEDIVVIASSNGEILQRMRGHTNLVSCLAFVEGSEKIVSGSWDWKIILWEWNASESPVRVLDGHFGFVSGIAVFGSERRLISSSWDGSLRLWDATSGAQTAELPRSRRINCVTVCEAGLKVALGFGNGTLQVLDLVTKAVIFEDAKAHGHSVMCLSFSPDGTYLATGSRGTKIRVWKTENWERVGEYIEDCEGWVNCVSFSPDGKQIASCSTDGTVRLWDVESGFCAGISRKMASHVYSVSFTPNGERIVTGSQDGIVRIWDAYLWSESKERRCEHSGRVNEVAISRNGLTVASASGDRTVRLWDSQTGDQIGRPLEGHTDGVNSISFSPDGRWVVSGSGDMTLRLWDAETQTQIDSPVEGQIGRPLEGHTDGVNSISFSPDGRWVVSGSGDMTLRLWDAETQTQIDSPVEGHTGIVASVSFSSDGRRIVSGSLDRTVRIWNAETHEQMGEALEGHAAPVDCVSESDDGRRIVSRDLDGITIIWDRSNKAIVWKSEALERNSGNGVTDEDKNSMSDDEAEKVIRSCGQQTPHLWPESFPVYTADLFGDEDCVYSNLLGEKTMMADSPFGDRWTYCREEKLFVAGLPSGGVAMCRFITE